jgi:hypothetical protein
VEHEKDTAPPILVLLPRTTYRATLQFAYGKTVLFSRSTDKGQTQALFAVPASGGQATTHEFRALLSG